MSYPESIIERSSSSLPNAKNWPQTFRSLECWVLFAWSHMECEMVSNFQVKTHIYKRMDLDGWVSLLEALDYILVCRQKIFGV